MPLHELQKVQLQERFTITTQESQGPSFIMSSGMESEETTLQLITSVAKKNASSQV